jgi:hypothetical protein
MAQVDDGTTIAAVDVMHFHEVVKDAEDKRYIRSMRGLVPVDESVTEHVDDSDNDDDEAAAAGDQAVPKPHLSEDQAIAALRGAMGVEPTGSEASSGAVSKKKKGLRKRLGAALRFGRKVSLAPVLPLLTLGCASSTLGCF